MAREQQQLRRQERDRTLSSIPREAALPLRCTLASCRAHPKQLGSPPHKLAKFGRARLETEAGGGRWGSVGQGSDYSPRSADDHQRAARRPLVVIIIIIILASSPSPQLSWACERRTLQQQGRCQGIAQGAGPQLGPALAAFCASLALPDHSPSPSGPHHHHRPRRVCCLRRSLSISPAHLLPGLPWLADRHGCDKKARSAAETFSSDERQSLTCNFSESGKCQHL